MTKWFAIGALLLASMALVGCGGNLPEGAVAKVGQVLVSQEQFKTLEAAYVATGRAPDKDSQEAEYARFQEGLARYLVILEILRQRGASFEVTVTTADVQREVDDIKGMFNGDQKLFDEALKKQNLTLDQLTGSVRDQLWLDRMKAAVTKGVAVTDEEAKAYYEAHKAEFVQVEQREVSHLLISPFKPSADTTQPSTPTQAEWEAARAEAEKIRGQIQGSADFASQAKQYSDDDATKSSGGELGLITKGQMTAAFEEAVFSLKKNQVSQPVKTQYGYHLILVTDIIPVQQLTYNAASEMIKGTILDQKKTQAWESWLAQQESELAVEYRDDLRPSAAEGASTRATAAPATSTEE